MGGWRPVRAGIVRSLRAEARTYLADGLVYTCSLAELCLHFKRLTKKLTGDREQRTVYTDPLR